MTRQCFIGVLLGISLALSWWFLTKTGEQAQEELLETCGQRYTPPTCLISRQELGANFQANPKKYYQLSQSCEISATARPGYVSLLSHTFPQPPGSEASRHCSDVPCYDAIEECSTAPVYDPLGRLVASCKRVIDPEASHFCSEVKCDQWASEAMGAQIDAWCDCENDDYSRGQCLISPNYTAWQEIDKTPTVIQGTCARIPDTNYLWCPFPERQGNVKYLLNQCGNLTDSERLQPNALSWVANEMDWSCEAISGSGATVVPVNTFIPASSPPQCRTNAGPFSLSPANATYPPLLKCPGAPDRFCISDLNVTEGRPQDKPGVWTIVQGPQGRDWKCQSLP